MIGINEVVQKVVEKPQSSFDPSKRVGEVNGETKKTTYDPSKRVESNTETNKEGEKRGLTDEQKEILKSKTEWPDEIINNIGSMEEAEIYINANLQVAEIKLQLMAGLRRYGVQHQKPGYGDDPQAAVEMDFDRLPVRFLYQAAHEHRVDEIIQHLSAAFRYPAAPSRAGPAGGCWR